LRNCFYWRLTLFNTIFAVKGIFQSVTYLEVWARWAKLQRPAL